MPNAVERSLLRVCFLAPGEAAREWEVRGREAAIDDLDPDAHGLLPLLHRRFVELGCTPPVLERLKGVRRRLWVQNELRFRAAREVLDELDAAGVATALVGGAGVLAAHLGRLDLRPIHDVDILIDDRAVADAHAALVARGRTRTACWRDGYALDVGAARYGEGDRSIVLRWSRSAPYDDAVARRRAVALSAGSFPVVEPADLLVHGILDGARTIRGARTRWVSDSLVVLDGDDLDWQRVVDVAMARNAGPTMAAALSIIDGIAPFPHPSGALAPLRDARRRPWQRALGGDASGPTTLLQAHARSSDAGVIRAAATLPRHVRSARRLARGGAGCDPSS